MALAMATPFVNGEFAPDFEIDAPAEVRDLTKNLLPKLFLYSLKSGCFVEKPAGKG